MATRQYSSSDAARYFRETGDKAGAEEILKAAVGKTANIPQAYKPRVAAPAPAPAPAPAATYKSSDAARYFRETGDKAGAEEILKAAVKLPANIPTAYTAKPAAPTPQTGAPVAKPPAPAPIRATPSPASPPAPATIAAPSPVIPPVAARPPARPPAPPPRATATSVGPQRAVTQNASRLPPPASQRAANPAMGGMPRPPQMAMAKGGKAQAYAKGGSVSSRGDGCAQRGKTKGRMI